MGHRSLGSVHRARHRPHVAIMAVAVPMIVVPMITTAIKTTPVEATGWAGTVATFGFMLGYALIAVGAPIFLRRVGVLSPLTWVVGIVGAVVMAFVFWANWLPQLIPGGLFPALSGACVWLPYVFLAWVAVGIVYFLVWRSQNPEKAKNAGMKLPRLGGAGRRSELIEGGARLGAAPPRSIRQAASSMRSSRITGIRRVVFRR